MCTLWLSFTHLCIGVFDYKTHNIVAFNVNWCSLLGTDVHKECTWNLKFCTWDETNEGGSVDEEEEDKGGKNHTHWNG